MTDNIRRDIVATFERNLDRDLAGIPPAQRLDRLRRAKVRFLSLLERLLWRIDSGQSPEFGESVVDYEMMIAAITKRIALEERRRRIIPTVGS